MVERQEPPKWLRDVVSDGLKHLVVLGLPGQPPAETIGMTGKAWIKALWKYSTSWDEAQDRPRLEEAFLTMLPEVERWPVPKDLIAALPPRPEPLKLMAPKMTEEQRLFNIEQVQKIKASLADFFKMPAPAKDKR
ncbi:hypothetical protein COW20_15155 [bacterium (Candidatus Blackallbacteria) CG13_big_fil_rev_8_21_14_2_50_49_14]|nr:MAG: hypothetical protein COW64_14995 [bacterium (Candidatus Blackallbacteria) CG18_big_fil_WC_8_21_14_2_50_49_26]PIW46625.1 MAG: hypothetical protein COW20_15155 [bacterium (Candidatus Blackallbacteria) CG13_big_fil_rev_8_21_14_2_50_49_14]